MNETMDAHSCWAEHIQNKQAVYGVFGSTVPPLNGLILRQVVVDPLSEVYVSVDFPSLPEGSPEKWRVEGNDRVQLRLALIHAGAVSLHGDLRQTYEYDQPVDMSLQKGKLLMRADERRFTLAVEFESAHVTFYPYDSSRLDRPVCWFRY